VLSISVATTRVSVSPAAREVPIPSFTFDGKYFSHAGPTLKNGLPIERKQRSTEICIELAIQINLPERPTAKRYPFGLGMAEESSE
jgi:hypothetical protein